MPTGFWSVWRAMRSGTASMRAPKRPLPWTMDVTRIGQVNVTDADYKRPELGYWLVPTVHGEGYGTESVSLAIDYAFRTYDAPAVGAEAYDFNDASRGLLESLGFTEEGRRRKYMFVDGAHRDMVQYGLLREEWREGRPESERG